MTVLLKIKERIAGPAGIYGIQNEWYGYLDEFKYAIGLPGVMGFGVGCCRPELLPADMMPMPGCEDRFSANYGNYLHLPSASIMAFIPAHYMEIQAAGNTNAPTYGTPVVITDQQVGNGVLPKAFRNNGANLAGVFVDKYQGSNCRDDGSGLPNNASGDPGAMPDSGGVFASRPLHWPVSAIGISGTTRSPFSLCNSTTLNPSATTPSDSLAGIWAVCKSRGVEFAPMPIWIRSQIAFLALAHAQALLDSAGNPISGATDHAAWMDTAPYAPKGNNSNGSDVNHATLSFVRTDIAGHNGSGFAGQNSRAFTGAAVISGSPAMENTTHNGQLSGIADVNGNQWDVVPGLTNVDDTAAGYRLFPESADWAATAGNSDITGAAGVIALAAESTPSADDGIWWTDANAWAYLIEHSGGTFHPTSAATATQRAITDCMLARELGTTGSSVSTNHYGGDGLYRRHRSDLLPFAGGNWANGAFAGVFAVNLNFVGGGTNGRIGGRASRLLSA